MICIVCRSAFLSFEIETICMKTGSAVKVKNFITDKQNSSGFLQKAETINPNSWLLSVLEKEKVSAVFFDSDFFTDTAAFRSASPSTDFIIVGTVNNETYVEEALKCGAAGFVLKPFSESAVLNCL